MRIYTVWDYYNIFFEITNTPKIYKKNMVRFLLIFLKTRKMEIRKATAKSKTKYTHQSASAKKGGIPINKSQINKYK